jgi:hypothetical protein
MHKKPEVKKGGNLMKKLVVLLWIVFFCLYSIAQEPCSSWIASQEGKCFCTKISVHAHKTRFVLQNGEKMSIPVDMINSYSLNGREFDKLPLYKNGKITNHLVFMELVERSNGMNLYRYGHCRNGCFRNKKTVHNYYMYNGNRLHQATNNIELPVALKNYDVKLDCKEYLLEYLIKCHH